jgi:hypothetical protein
MVSAGSVKLLVRNTSHFRFSASKVADAAQAFGVALFAVEAMEPNDLIGVDPGRPIDGARLEVAEPGVPLGAGHEEAESLVEPVAPSEVEVGPIEDIDGARLDRKLIEDIHVVHPPGRDEQHAGDVASQVQERVQLHRSLAFAERGLGEQCQTQVDDGRIQGIHRLHQLDPKGLGGVEGTGRRNQPLGEVGVEVPVTDLVGMGERIAGHRAAEPHVVELGLGHAEASLNIPQTLPESHWANARQRN